MVRSDKITEAEHLRPQRLAAREREQLPHQRRGRCVLLICMMS
jgi:hypothetical protein